MTQPHPPHRLAALLHILLSDRTRETVTGDLAEAYAEHAQQHGTAVANAWYRQQVFSLVPLAFKNAWGSAPVLALLCLFTGACGAWLGTMDIVLHHHDLIRHESIAGLIVGEAMLTLGALPFARVAGVRVAALVGAAAVTWLGLSAWYATLHSADTEGYILLIGLALVVQALLTARAMLFRRARAA